MKKKKLSPLSNLVRRRLRDLRQKSGLTQENLCDLAGVSSDAVSRIEGGSRVPRLDTLEKLTRVLDTDVSSIVSTEEMPKSEYPQSIVRILYMLLQQPPEVHEACEKLLKSALDGFTNPDIARAVLNEEKKRKRRKV